jgi:hypothetical protein
MPVDIYVYKVVVRYLKPHSEAHLRTFYFQHTGSISLNTAIRTFLEGGQGAQGLDWKLESVEQLGILVDLLAPKYNNPNMDAEAQNVSPQHQEA